MKVPVSLNVLLVLLSQMAGGREPSIRDAARKFVPGVTWQTRSVVTGDFSCRGLKEHAILGVSPTEIVIAAFLDGTNHPPEVLLYSTKAWSPSTAKMRIESLDYDPMEELGYDLEGFQRSKICKGLNLRDLKTDSSHIYWNHESHGFDEWSR
jgi:hypothetical protein